MYVHCYDLKSRAFRFEFLKTQKCTSIRTLIVPNLVTIRYFMEEKKVYGVPITINAQQEQKREHKQCPIAAFHLKITVLAQKKIILSHCKFETGPIVHSMSRHFS